MYYNFLLAGKRGNVLKDDALFEFLNKKGTLLKDFVRDGVNPFVHHPDWDKILKDEQVLICVIDSSHNHFSFHAIVFPRKDKLDYFTKNSYGRSKTWYVVGKNSVESYRDFGKADPYFPV